MSFGNTENTVYPTLLWDKQNIILVDCGFIGSLPYLEKELRRHGLSAEQITGLVLTHHDHDHIGSLNDIKDKNQKIKILSSEIEAEYISGRQKSLRLIQAEQYNETLTGKDKEFGEQFVQYLKTVNICLIDEIVHDKDSICTGVSVVYTPGHTPGHISLYLEEENTLLAGDAVAIENDKLVIANPQFTLDMSNALNSIAKIKSMKIEKIICYHGGIISKFIDNELGVILKKNEYA
jgi:glyoxylase-like metal-dependent hydrolase (beta-lactamase superfamily II)